MNKILQHLVDLPDDVSDYEPRIEHASLSALIRSEKNDKEGALARAKTVAMLFNHGMEAELDEEEEHVATQQFHRHLQHMPIQTNVLTKPGIVMKLSALLSEYDHEVVRDAVQMRQYVTNRLLEESDPKMPAGQRLRALQMLGQITEIGLFTERVEMTVKTMPMDNLEARLYDKLKTLLPQEYTEILNETKDAE